MRPGAPAPARSRSTKISNYLLDKGLIKGGSLENAVLIRNETILATEPLRFVTNSCGIRFSMCSLALLGRPLAAHVVLIRPGHTSNAELTRALKRQLDKQMPAPPPFIQPQPEAPTETAMDTMRLMNVLPHRYPVPAGSTAS